MPDIAKLIEGAKAKLAKMLDEEFYLLGPAFFLLSIASTKQHINLNCTQLIAWASQNLEIRKLQCKSKMETVLDELKVELMRGIVEREALAKNKYEVVFLKLKSHFCDSSGMSSQMREVIDLQEGDIPISYQTYMSMFCTGSSSGTAPTGGQQIVREVVVLRPVVER